MCDILIYENDIWILFWSTDFKENEYQGYKKTGHYMGYVVTVIFFLGGVEIEVLCRNYIYKCTIIL